MNGEPLVLPGQGWKHTMRIGPNGAWTEDVLGFIVLDLDRPRVVPITRTPGEGVVWHPEAGDVDLPEHVRLALGLPEADNVTITCRSRWPG